MPDTTAKCPATKNHPAADAKKAEFERNDTKCNTLPGGVGLSDVQQRAIELTVMGLPDARIARMLRVTRVTLYRWKTQDRRYIEELFDLREQVRGKVTDEYQASLLEANRVLRKSLKQKSFDRRFRAAQALLNMAGNIKPLPRPNLPIPPFDPRWVNG